jgi:hypothetical protein
LYGRRFLIWAGHTSEFARLADEEWRASLVQYAKQHIYAHVQAAPGGGGSGSPDNGVGGPEVHELLFNEWFGGWLASIQHMMHLLAPTDGSPPLLGFGASGTVVSVSEATAPPLPLHPFPPAAPHRHQGGERGDDPTSRSQPSPGDSRLAAQQQDLTGVEPDLGFFSDLR